MNLLDSLRMKLAGTPLYTPLVCLGTGVLGILIGRHTRPTPTPTVVTTGDTHTVQVVHTDTTAQKHEELAKQQTQVVTVEHVVTRVVYRDPVTSKVTKEVTTTTGPTTTRTSSASEEELATATRTRQVSSTETATHTVTTTAPPPASSQADYSLALGYSQPLHHTTAADWLPGAQHADLTAGYRVAGPVWLEAGGGYQSAHVGLRVEW